MTRAGKRRDKTMNYNSIKNTYLENSVMTATPEQLTLMLYNGCIKNINLAKRHMDENNIETTNRYINKAQDIIFELKATLNFKIDISRQLSAMYDFIIERLIDANIRKDPENLDIALKFVTDIRGIWYEAMKLKENPEKESKVV